MMSGYDYRKKTFFPADGTPRYYHRRTLPPDNRRRSRAIDPLFFFPDRDRDALAQALEAAQWMVANIEDRIGYFYCRRYSERLADQTPTLQWGPAAMPWALSGLYQWI